jgi:uncharacterized membrane protein
MLDRLYWLLTATVLAVAVHAAYMLIAPGIALDRSISRTAASVASNQFQVLKPEDQSILFPNYPASSVFGICAFDVSTSAVELSATMPEGFWTLTIYSRSGNVIYALNSTQSGTNTFTVSVVKAPGLVDAITKPAVEDPGSYNGLKATTPESKGIAVLWVPVGEVAQRAAVTRVLGNSRCRSSST